MSGRADFFETCVRICFHFIMRVDASGSVTSTEFRICISLLFQPMVPTSIARLVNPPVERYNQQLQLSFLEAFDSEPSDCFNDLYKLYIISSMAVYIASAIFLLCRGNPKYLIAVLLTGFMVGVKLAAGHYAFTQLANGARHQLMEELAGQLSLLDGDLRFVVNTSRAFVLPSDALFAFVQTVTAPVCLLLSLLFENKRPLYLIAAIAFADFCWLIATPNSFNFFEKFELLDMISKMADIRASIFLYAPAWSPSFRLYIVITIGIGGPVYSARIIQHMRKAADPKSRLYKRSDPKRRM